jgi:hypothetical protein
LISRPEGLSYYQAAEILSDATGKKIDYVNISDEEDRGAMREIGLNDWLVNTILELYSYFRKGRASRCSLQLKK